MHPKIGSREAELRQLCAKHKVRRLALFGSAATSNPSEVGDFDFLIEFQPMTPVEHAEHYFSLLSDLERLLKARVDLVESSTVRNPFLRQSIEASQIALYDAA
jgi:predicted nucleotidyltransferase